jgi:16S rRNA U1498 N3-methylase RsmE
VVEGTVILTEDTFCHLKKLVRISKYAKFYADFKTQPLKKYAESTPSIKKL